MSAPRVQTYVTTEERKLFVSTVPSKGGSKPMGCVEDIWQSETCAWELDLDTNERIKMVFGPDYHSSDDTLAMHIRALPAVLAGCAYISDFEEVDDAE